MVLVHQHNMVISPWTMVAAILMQSQQDVTVRSLVHEVDWVKHLASNLGAYIDWPGELCILSVARWIAPFGMFLIEKIRSAVKVTFCLVCLYLTTRFSCLLVGFLGSRKETAHWKKNQSFQRSCFFKTWSRSKYSFACFAYCHELCVSDFCLPSSFNFIFCQILLKCKVVCLNSESDFCLWHAGLCFILIWTLWWLGH